MIATSGLILLAIIAILVSGYGPALLLMDRQENRSRAVAIPVIGLACFLVATHFLAGLGAAGRAASLGALGILVICGLAVPRARRLDRKEIRESLAVFAICGAAVLLAAWPLLHEGYSSYVAFGNPDGASNLAINEGFLRDGYAMSSEFPSFWPHPQFAQIFGGGYICVLLAVVTGANILKLHDVAAAAIVFVLPAAIFLFSVICLGVSRRIALIATVAAAMSSQACFTFYLQSFGAITFIALLPGFPAVFAEALDTRRFRQILCAALLLTGASFGYYAALPIMGVMLAAQVASVFARRAIGWRDLCRMAAIVVAVAFLAYPALTTVIVERSMYEAGSSHLVTTLQGEEVKLSFAFALTEQLAPFFWGVLIPPLAGSFPFGPPYPGYLLAGGLGVLLTAVLIWLLFRWRSPVRPETRLEMGALSLVVAYYFLRNHAYGAFKLAGWLSPLFIAFLTCGVLQAAPAGIGRKWFNRFRYGLLAGMMCLNLGWALEGGRASLPSFAGPTAKNLGDFTARDFDGLTSLGTVVPADQRLLVAISDSVVQRWALTFLKRSNVSVVPYLGLSPEGADPAEQTAAEGAESASYILTWSKSGDLIPTIPEHPLWHNARFQVASVSSVKDLPVFGRGWYRTERIAKSPQQWQHQFRWLRTRGEILLLNGSGEERRLRLTIVPGYGLPLPQRSVSFALNGEKFDEVDTSGIATVITKPFRASGFMNRLTISVPDQAQPIPNPWLLIRRWVPKDGRRLNIAIANVELLSDQQYAAIHLPCRIDLARPDDWKVPGLDGVYGDGWVSAKGRVLLEPCGAADAVLVEGVMPPLPKSQPPFPVMVSINGVEHTIQLATAGPFSISVPLPETARHDPRYEITVWSPRTFVPGGLLFGRDPRRLSILLKAIELHQPGAMAPEHTGK